MYDHFATLWKKGLMRNLEIIGPQSENNFPWRYDVISNDVIFPALCACWCLKIIVLVHFCGFLYATFNLNTIFWINQLNWMQKFWNIHQKIIYDVISGKLRVLETFDDQVFHYVLSVSLNLIWVLRHNFTTS